MSNIRVTAEKMFELTQKAFEDCLFKEGEDIACQRKCGLFFQAVFLMLLLNKELNYKKANVY